MIDYDLYIFDIDGTLCDRDSTELYPHVVEWLEANNPKHIALATNQGGVGLRYWMETNGFGEPEKYPTENDIKERINRIVTNILAVCPSANITPYVAYRYQSRKGSWSPYPENLTDEGKYQWSETSRKPNGLMLRRAMKRHKVEPHHTIMVGDMETDKQAAENNLAGCHFAWAHEFFRVGSG